MDAREAEKIAITKPTPMGHRVVWNKGFTVYVIALAVVFTVVSLVPVQAAQQGDCSAEPDMAARSDVLMCDPFESETWWSDHGYIRDSTKSNQVPAQESQMEYTSIINQDCIAGNCLKVETPERVTRSLSIHWPTLNAGVEPEELYFRYYFKIGQDWTADQCIYDDNGNFTGYDWPPSGKFWGFADPRGAQDPGGQCGNGGARPNGLDCWSVRGVFEGCSGPGLSDNSFPYDDTCEFVPNARLRIGSYIYVPDNGTTHGAGGLWDKVPERASMGDDYSSACRRGDPDNPDPECYCESNNNMYCGMGTGGMLVPERWYAVETYIKMNTPGVADGVIRGWIDDVLSYEKTNVRFRDPGHDNLHIRTLWLNTYKGGTNGNCEDSELYYDQLVIAGERIGMIDSDLPPAPNISISANPASITLGGSSTVTWNAANATSCEAMGAWSGNRNLTGSESVVPAATSTYTLSCTGDGGTREESVTVNVGSATVPTVSLSADPTTVNAGGSSQLTWTSTDADSCEASGGWSGDQDTENQAGVSIGPISNDTTYTLTCTGTGGMASDMVTVTVNDSGVPDPQVAFTSNTETINSGESVVLSWSVQNAVYCQASGGNNRLWFGSKDINGGSEAVGPLTNNTSFSLACRNSVNVIDSKTINISVNGGVTAPTVSLTATPSVVPTGGDTVLTWSSTNADFCDASGDWSGSNLAVSNNSPGVTQSGITSDKTYILTCTGDGGSAGQSIQVTVTSGDPDDTDNDGLPDDWEMGSFGHLDQSGSDDFDNDGFTNAQEQAAGSNPTDSNSTPDLANNDEDSGGGVVFWLVSLYVLCVCRRKYLSLQPSCKV